MAQQTAVEWLVNHWKKLQSKGEKMSWQQIIDITELAKQREKEQIKNAYIVGSVDELPYDEDAQQYYTQTYGK